MIKNEKVIVCDQCKRILTKDWTLKIIAYQNKHFCNDDCLLDYLEDTKKIKSLLTLEIINQRGK
ncbi:hypothetical protein OZX58_03195 [Lactobacillus sp. ESL0680]|uniref:hypothetical protein n=1 Tax=Lactobacillus sp. ESL0680 TaxID=2983210 RepID=UPI0023F932BA|nr:hypothetical protein [Lactobacillus sp. ESL0680]WEV39256.1 hypothetical protein OZX58_03195 [Lactobacillus sp. ESL0680]